MNGFKAAFRVLRQRERARKNLWEFAEQTVLRRLPKRYPAPHHEFICGALQAFMEDPESDILCLLMPPGSAKTLFASRILPAWLMGRVPGTRVIAISNSLPLAESNGRAVREIMQSKTYTHIFGNTTAVGSSAAGFFSSTNGSTFFAAGVGGSVIGRRGDVVICDDLVSGIEEAQSDTQMGKLWEAFETNILTRLTKGAKLIVVMQRLAALDPVGRLLEKKASGVPGRRIDVIRLPMLADSADDPMGRVEGEPLWPAYFTRGMLLDAQSDPLRWKTLYQQKPAAASGEWCASTDLIVSPAPRGVVGHQDWNVMIGVDVAHTVGGGDATVFAVMAMNRRTGELHFVELYREHVDGATSCEALLDLAEFWRPIWIGIDGDGGSKGWVSHLRTRAFTRGVQLPIELVPMRGRSKELRAGALRAKLKSGLVHLDREQPWAGVVLREFVGFPYLTGSAVDDTIDAVGLVAQKTALMAARTAPAVVDKKILLRTDACLEELFSDNEHRPSNFRIM